MSTTTPASSIASYLAQTHRLFVAGDWLDAKTDAALDIIDPSTGRSIAKVQAGVAQDVDGAVHAARKAFDEGPWPRMMPGHRRKLLLALADAMESHADEFALIDSLNMGMPLWLARYIVDLCVEIVRYNAGWIDKIAGDTLAVSAPDHHAYTLKEPIGVVGAIVPWNAPLFAAITKLAPALAAGCTTILKPAELTPLSALRLVEFIQKVGFPPGVVNVVPGLGHLAGQALVEHPGVDKISFTGSTVVGQSIVRSVAGTMKRLSLELGGKSPVFVFADADLDRAIPGAAMGIFGNSGQVCAAGSRLYVHAAVFERVIEAIADQARALKVGPAQEPGVQIGPLVSQKQLDRVGQFIDAGRQEGATVLAGGERLLGGGGYFLQPTVLTQARPEMSVVREEIFGPVLCAAPFDDDDLTRLAGLGNDSRYGLSAYIWTKNISAAHKLARLLRTGSVMINGGTPVDANVPFGGYKQSGWGREYGREGVEAFLETKSVTVAL
jgi:phenylacetaldehyde dehydrogenase